MIELSEFINKYLGKKVDYDGAFGAQCVDLFRQYTKEVLGVAEHTGAVEGAKDLWEKYGELPKEQKYFKPIQRVYGTYGDVAIWGATSKNRYGHVAIMIERIGNQILVFEQDGFKQDGAKLAWRSTENLLGFLRRK